MKKLSICIIFALILAVALPTFAVSVKAQATNKKGSAMRVEAEMENEEEGFTPDQAPMGIDQERERERVRVRAEDGLQIQGTTITITGSSTGSTTEFKMKTALPAFYNRLELALRKQNASSSIEELELKVVDDQPIYEASLIEAGKLFGLIPLKVKTTATINVENNEIEQVKKPWYSFLVTKLISPEVEIAE